jgi:hypothetical protein
VKTVEKAMETAGGVGFYREAGLERLFRDIQASRYHPLPDKTQARLSGRVLLGAGYRWLAANSHGSSNRWIGLRVRVHVRVRVRVRGGRAGRVAACETVTARSCTCFALAPRQRERVRVRGPRSRLRSAPLRGARWKRAFASRPRRPPAALEHEHELAHASRSADRSAGTNRESC